MSVEKIIEQIKKDSETEIRQIRRDAERKRREILAAARKEAEDAAMEIVENGEKTLGNKKRVEVAKTRQEAKKEIMKTREKLIEECFIKAKQKLSQIKDDEYEKLLSKLLEKGVEKLEGNCTVLTSREIDKKIVERHGLKVTGKTDAAGGVILISEDGRITLDYTLDGILRREKQKIRIKIGRMLFS